jgi:hypothetical protein
VDLGGNGTLGLTGTGGSQIIARSMRASGNPSITINSELGGLAAAMRQVMLVE